MKEYCRFMSTTLYGTSLSIMLAAIGCELFNRHAPAPHVILWLSLAALITSFYFEYRYIFFLEQDNRRHRGHLD